MVNDFLKFSGRPRGGKAHKELAASLDRLKGTTLTTNVEVGGIVLREGAGLIDSYSLVCRPQTGRVIAWEIVISQWLIRAILSDEVLTLHKSYFTIKSSLGRRLYEIARKHCGAQLNFKIGIDKLQAKSGSSQPSRNFKIAVAKLSDADELPEYSFWIDGKFVIFQNRSQAEHLEKAAICAVTGQLDPGVYHDARQIAPGWDVYGIEHEWANWMRARGLKPPQHPEKAFLGFCRKWVQQR